eukprot:COSAG05_NODE_3295_length_2170_cov_4991.631579_3_plen_123_part_00
MIAVCTRRLCTIIWLATTASRAAADGGHARHVDGAARRARAAAGVVGVVAIGARRSRALTLRATTALRTLCHTGARGPREWWRQAEMQGRQEQRRVRRRQHRCRNEMRQRQDTCRQSDCHIV